ncbi:yuh1p [Saccharomyces arboricola H-6]|uniref:Ubiquitin carboxyl-terminal hydrolase n=1 Tax=Saccharomyces arboricola (strain H-6 / AS 2.3317 / CBS 10644) TaxID=1160507 RepID=J8PLW6_SACAR|nr:yuh1p [Saccharomyces arboricola H-6]
MSKDERAVVPIESNPVVFTEFAHKLGLKKEWAYFDIYSLTETELLAFLPRPVKAIVLLFPMNESKQSLVNQHGPKAGGSNVLWFKQSVKNACGLYAVLHSLSNNQSLLEPETDLVNFLNSQSNSSTPKRMFDDTIADEFVSNVINENTQTFSTGQSEAPEATVDINLHYITYVEENGEIFELDGRNLDGPLYLGKSDPTAADLVEQNLVRQRVISYMENANEEDVLNFAMLGLGPNWE